MSDFGISAAAAGANMKSWTDAIAAQVRTEEAEALLDAVTRPAHLAEVLAEVDRRAEVYAKAWRERPEPPPDSETPRYAALRSVYADVAAARLG